MVYCANEKRYEKMIYRRCGNRGIKLPVVSLGMWYNFGSVHSYENAKQMIFTAFDLGITHFDLANNYGPVPGGAEITMGRVLKEGLGAYRDELIISSKAGHDMWPGPYGGPSSGRKYLLASLDQSLKRMGLDYVDIFYTHRYNDDAPLEETMTALADAVRMGKALYVGISGYDPGKTKASADILKSLNVPCLIVQPHYNMLDRNIENGLQDVILNEGMGTIAFCALEQGLLTSKYLKEIPSGSRVAGGTSSIKPEHIDEKMRLKLNKLNDIAAGRNQTLSQLAVAWVLREGKVTSALIGASRREQIIENVKAIENLDFTADELKEIDKILSGETI